MSAPLSSTDDQTPQRLTPEEIVAKLPNRMPHLFHQALRVTLPPRHQWRDRIGCSIGSFARGALARRFADCLEPKLARALAMQQTQDGSLTLEEFARAIVDTQLELRTTLHLQGANDEVERKIPEVHRQLPTSDEYAGLSMSCHLQIMANRSQPEPPVHDGHHGHATHNGRATLPHIRLAPATAAVG